LLPRNWNEWSSQANGIVEKTLGHDLESGSALSNHTNRIATAKQWIIASGQSQASITIMVVTTVKILWQSALQRPLKAILQINNIPAKILIAPWFNQLAFSTRAIINFSN
jgi:hypothetical protein